MKPWERKVIACRIGPPNCHRNLLPGDRHACHGHSNGHALTTLKEEETLFRTAVRDFAEEAITPFVASMDDNGRLEPSLLPKLFDLGLMGIEIPEAYGGPGGTFFMSCLAIEELSRVDAAVAVVVDVHNTLVTNAILRWGTAGQHAAFLPMLAKHAIASYSLSEADAGSDAFALQTRATRQGDQYLLNGRKLWTSNAREADLFIIFANVDPTLGHKGITAFLVERDTPGLQVGKSERKLGIRATSTCELLLDNCAVPAANVLGKVGEGYKVAIETLNEGRIGIGARWSASPQALCRPLSATLKRGSSSANRSVPSRPCSFNWPRWRPRSKPPGSWSTTPRASKTLANPSWRKRR